VERARARLDRALVSGGVSPPPATFSPGEVCAVVVTFHPGADVAANLAAIVAECGRAIVVDNGSGPDARRAFARVDGVSLVALDRNEGVAAALNRGAIRALADGARWVVTFDQDSRPRPGFLAALRATQTRFPGAAVIGARIEETALAQDYRWLRPRRNGGIWFERVRGLEDLPDVTMVVSSGALTELETWRALGGFDERLFIDFVDTDYCLRCREAGRTIAVSAAAWLEHNLGRRETRRFLGRTFHPTHHPPLRHYFIARNRIPMLRRHARREPHWMLFEFSVMGLWLFRILAFEQQRLAKLRAILLGTLDGLRGRSGPCPPERETALHAPA